MPNFLAYLIGVLGALVLCLGATQFSDQIVVEFFGAFLALTAASYFGSALSQKNFVVFVQESAISLAIFGTALLGLWLSPLWISLGYFAHGAWDLVHHSHRGGAKIFFTWFPPACLAFDWIVALYLLWRV